MRRIARGQSGVKWPQRREVKPALAIDIGSVQHIPICIILNTLCLTSHFDTRSKVL